VILRWYIDGTIGRAKTWVGGTYQLDKDYVPKRVNISVRETGERINPTIIDINDDGVSIFANEDSNPAISAYDNYKTWDTFQEGEMLQDSIITLDIDSVCEEKPVRDLTVELELEES
jgi:hypothetical protein